MKKLKDLFHIHNGIPSNKVNILNEYIPGSVKYARPSNNYDNTHAGYVVSDVKVFDSETIFVSTDGQGSHTYSYVSTERFVPNSNVIALIPKAEMNLYEKFYYAICITKNRFKFSYGRKPKGHRIENILLPEKFEIPDWVYLADLKEYAVSVSPVNEGDVYKINTSNWIEFSLTDLFDITGTTTTPVKKLKSIGGGEYPYVTTQASNNGVGGFYDYRTENGNVLTMDSAVIGYCSYQDTDFSASDHVEKLTPRFHMNKYIAIFISAVINNEQYRFNYGRKCSQTRLKKIKIKLPTINNQPDWDFMENYIKSLPYSNSI